MRFSAWTLLETTNRNHFNVKCGELFQRGTLNTFFTGYSVQRCWNFTMGSVLARLFRPDPQDFWIRLSKPVLDNYFESVQLSDEELIHQAALVNFHFEEDPTLPPESQLDFVAQFKLYVLVSTRVKLADIVEENFEKLGGRKEAWNFYRATQSNGRTLWNRYYLDYFVHFQRPIQLNFRSLPKTLMNHSFVNCVHHAFNTLQLLQYFNSFRSNPELSVLMHIPMTRDQRRAFGELDISRRHPVVHCHRCCTQQTLKLCFLNVATLNFQQHFIKI